MRLYGRHSRLLAKCWCLLVVIRIGLTVSSYNVLAKRVDLLAVSKRGSVPTSLLSWAVRQSARLVPCATCLTQALVMRILLRQAGLASSICIGVNMDERGAFGAHAWVVCDDEIVIGGHAVDLTRYTRIAEL